MKSVFPQSIRNLPQAIIPFIGVNGYIVQGEKEQVVFMEFEKDTKILNIHIKATGK